MRWKIGAFLVAILAIAGASIFVSAEAPVRGASREGYKRPAEIPYPDDNPYSAAKAELGRKLFFDPILSGAHNRSCGSCHNPSLSWGGGIEIGKEVGHLGWLQLAISRLATLWF